MVRWWPPSGNDQDDGWSRSCLAPLVTIEEEHRPCWMRMILMAQTHLRHLGVTKDGNLSA